jgi:SAM-dependent methyltransferase
MMDDQLQLLVDLHRRQAPQGPGAEAETRRALDLTRIDRSAPLRAADIGCGTGASTLVLARALNAQITAVDFLPEFLEVLMRRAEGLGLAGKITPLACSMDDLSFADHSLDLMWSEGAIYNIGFERGIRAWRRFLKPGGVLAVSEITWLTASRPAEIQAYWEEEYPEIDTAAAKMHQLEQNGYEPVGYFTLPARCWLAHYYRPLQAGFAAFLERHGDSPAAREIAAAEAREIELYETYGGYYSYGFYMGRRVG